MKKIVEIVDEGRWIGIVDALEHTTIRLIEYGKPTNELNWAIEQIRKELNYFKNRCGRRLEKKLVGMDI